MAEVARTVRFDAKLWDEIDRDAQRCMRSSVKQMEAVLSAYYRLRNVELDEGAIRKARDPDWVAPVEHKTITKDLTPRGRKKRA